MSDDEARSDADRDTTADTDTAAPETLRFEDDKGSKRSTWIAGGILVAIVAWMGSGYILPTPTPEEEADQGSTRAPVAVAVRPSSAEEVTLYFQAEGQAMPDRDTILRAEISGDVAEVLVKKGEDVERNQVIARLASEQLRADLARAEEALNRAQREFDNASTLLERGVATTDRVADAEAALANARAQQVAAAEALESVEIRAPFGGRIETLSLDEGEFVSGGSEVGRIVDNTPLTVALQVPQQALNRVQSGLPARVTFITGEERAGEVSFVGTAAAAETRTFLAEITVANDDGAIPAGISAEIRIPTGTAKAHFISPSAVSLSPEGLTGVKTVQDDVVQFHPIEVVRAEIDGIWVTGLPDSADIITIGQGFVQEGETVDASPEPETGS